MLQVLEENFLDWLSDGKPRCGPSFQLMLKSRAAFKQALRFCKRHKVQLQADALAYSYKNSDSKQFWKKISDISNSKATAHVNKIGDVIGEENICSMWYDYFKTLYNSVPDNGESNIFLSTCSALTDNDVACVSVREVMDAVSGLRLLSLLDRMVWLYSQTIRSNRSRCGPRCGHQKK